MEQPQGFEKLLLSALELQKSGDIDGARTVYQKLLAINPDDFDALHFLGVTYIQSGEPSQGVPLIKKALEIRPDSIQALNNCGSGLRDMGEYQNALSCYDKSLALNPSYVDALNNRGVTYRRLKRLDEAIADYDRALLLRPDYAVALNNRGIALRDQRRVEEAVRNYDQALDIRPNYADAHNNRATALQELSRFEEALSSLNQAIAIKPCYAEAFYNRGNVLKDLRRYDEAIDSYRQAFKINPNLDYLLGIYLHTKAIICDWGDLVQNLRHLENMIIQDEKATLPFPLLGLIDSPALQLKAATSYAQNTYPATNQLGPIAHQNSTDKIRIGYFSGDFHNHATAFLMAELFESHDSNRFEIFGFSFGPKKTDEMRQRIAVNFSEFIEVSEMSDHAAAKLARDMGIDIAVDLKGYTGDCRAGIFAERCAPIQVSYLGFPGTMGAEYIDYIIADSTLVPEETEKYYNEKVVRMPHSYQVNDSKRTISSRSFSREELGLPAEGFVYCCFNNNYKIMPETFDSWMKILKKTAGSVLWLLEDNPLAVKNLRHEAHLRDVDPDRLVFAPRMALEEHLARHRLADLFLDTLPCNAHTTASDALWAGLPVLTRIGESFASRVAASLVRAVGLPELAVSTQEAYERWAVDLALDNKRLSSIRDRLMNARVNAPLFDGRLFAKDLERAFEVMCARYRAGLPPINLNA